MPMRRVSRDVSLPVQVRRLRPASDLRAERAAPLVLLLLDLHFNAGKLQIEGESSAFGIGIGGAVVDDGGRRGDFGAENAATSSLLVLDFDT